MFVYSWNAHSESAASLSKSLGAKRIKHENSKFKGAQRKVVINWGSSKVPEEVKKCVVLNEPQKVAICANKLEFFKVISEKEVSVPDWTTDSNTAFQWVADGNIVCARTVLSGHSGEGLVLMTRDDPDSLVKAPLYTKYIPKVDEYRVHVVKGDIIDVQRKALRPNWHEENEGKPNFKVRNLANGFIFVRGGVNPPALVTEQAVKVVDAVGLDFGAVDIVWNQKRGQAYVLEVNTAPGLEGTTLDNYTDAFSRL